MTNKEFQELFTHYRIKYGKGLGFGKGKWYYRNSSVAGQSVTYYNAEGKECVNFLSRNMTREQVITCFEAMKQQEDGEDDN